MVVAGGLAQERARGDVGEIGSPAHRLVQPHGNVHEQPRRHGLGATQERAGGLGGGFGWFLAIALIGGIREKIREESVPRGLAGPGITLIIIGIMALAFVGFSGMIRI